MPRPTHSTRPGAARPDIVRSGEGRGKAPGPGLVLAVAVFLDALLMRLVVLPIVLRVAGHGAWHRPAGLRRVLPRVNFSSGDHPGRY